MHDIYVRLEHTETPHVTTFQLHQHCPISDNWQCSGSEVGAAQASVANDTGFSETKEVLPSKDRWDPT